MQLEKAIEILNLSKDPDFEGDSNDFYEALQLGIEALEVIRGYREIQPVSYPKLLPSELERTPGEAAVSG